MIIQVDLEKLIDYNMNIQDYLFCSFIYTGEKKLLDDYLSLFDRFFTRETINNLEVIGYINFKIPNNYAFSNFTVTQKFIDEFIEKPFVSKLRPERVEDWIDEWYDIFPKGIKSGGYLVRSDKNGCIVKLKAFIKKNPTYTKEIILRATKDYVNYFRLNGFNYMQLASYFITKNGISTLAGYCENVDLAKDNDYNTDPFESSLNQ